MEVSVLTPNLEKQWDHFVANFPQATLAHELGWRNVVEGTYHHTSYYLMAVEHGIVCGVLPLFLIKSRIFGRILATSPYLSYGGLLASHIEAARHTIDVATQIALAEHVKYLEIRGLVRADERLLLKNKYCTALLPLVPDAAMVWQNFESRARKAVRKALKSGLQIAQGHHLVEVFAEVMSQHKQELGTPFHGLSLYRHILAEFSSHADILMVHRHGQYLGGLLWVESNDVILLLYGGVLKDHRSYSPMSLLVWGIVQYGCTHGFKYLDFGRSQWGSGTLMFKRQWGARPYPLFYEYDLPRGGSMPDTDPTNPKYQLASTIWKRLPTFAAKALGPLIIRDIP